MSISVGCEAVRQLTDGYYHKWLAPSVMGAFADHVGQCSDCQSVVKQYEVELKMRLLKLLAEQEDDPEKVEELWGRFLLEGTVECP